MKFSSVKRNVYGKTAGFTSSRNDASSSAMMACLKGAVVIDAPKWGWDRHYQLEDALRDFCRAVVPLRMGIWEYLTPVHFSSTVRFLYSLSH